MKSNKTLKQLKTEIEIMENEDDYSSVINLCEETIKRFPKNAYGYVKLIEIKTDNYKRYLSENEIKDLKKIYSKAYELSSMKEQATLEKNFEEYLEDSLEVENLKKLKKDIISNILLKKIYTYVIANINIATETSKKYRLSGEKITSIYDFIKGIFFLSCLIYNIINPNYLLILTIPFGVFGLIMIYSFFNMNFIKKETLLSEKVIFSRKTKKINDKINAIKEEVKKKENLIESLYNSKSSNILKIPNTFTESIKDIISDNEDTISSSIMDEYISGNMALFTYMVTENTNLKSSDLLAMIDINKSSEENKGLNKNILFIKKIKIHNYYTTLILLIISILSLIVILKNNSELNMTSFVISCIVGIISTLIYNINSGKKNSYVDTFNDSLLSTIFNTTLVYDLLYSSITGNLRLTYGFIQMPLTFILIFIGFVSLISLLKYNNLIKKVRK